MKVFNIVPHEGIGPARLGASRENTRLAMTADGFTLKHDTETQDYFDLPELGIQVEYSAGQASFIGVSCYAACQVMYDGVNVFDTEAEELFGRMARADGSGEHSLNTHEHLFPRQILTLWDADEQYDRMGGEERRVWAQVGLGDADYLAAISKQTH
ncbi:hypothetical protein [Pseudomonas asplenii]|uniref:Uncharacterized protein n=1 Tax=Pseudomonas asplenii TaxID=53407 RepID=A0A0N0VJL7_9PSED|nr:hypothetical protein [Pseudomonas fuscovaginae]KPA90716.1 hypothetical protein PF66_02778 [Pseudomonas fuscovaginae]KPA94198.1 hypothetical protein PF70_05849 [Pseudomonas fuscovaginae]